ESTVRTAPRDQTLVGALPLLCVRAWPKTRRLRIIRERRWKEVVNVSDDFPKDCGQVPGYEILRPIGRGSMGVVVLARQLTLGREGAIKFLDVAAAADPGDQVARFRREAELMARISHPNIATIYDFGTVDGRPYLVMEYIGGGDLRGKMVAQK